MAKMQIPQTMPTYDPRWFVWTIMFLLVTGVSLVVYIIMGSDDTSDSQTIVRHQTRNLVQNSAPNDTPVK